MLELGQVVLTPGLKDALMQNGMGTHQLYPFLQRHETGDWGELCKEDKEANDYAIKNKERILSAYDINGIKFWIITEWDRSVTTMLLPSEY